MFPKKNSFASSVRGESIFTPGMAQDSPCPSPAADPVATFRLIDRGRMPVLAHQRGQDFGAVPSIAFPSV